MRRNEEEKVEQSSFDTPQAKIPVSSNIDQSTIVNRTGPGLNTGLKGDEPVEAATPKLSPSKPLGIPGYVSKFTQYPTAEEKSLIESIEDGYKNKTDWNLTRSSESSLFYSSKTMRQLAEEYQNSLRKVEIEESETLASKILLPGSLILLILAFLSPYFLPNICSILLAFVAIGGAGFHIFNEGKKIK